jgi:formamidopyrimidine-DNA glycosylase
LDDEQFRSVEGQRGQNQEILTVFRRTGSPCPRCGAPIQRIRLGGRSTHFCPSCQT